MVNPEDKSELVASLRGVLVVLANPIASIIIQRDKLLMRIFLAIKAMDDPLLKLKAYCSIVEIGQMHLQWRSQCSPCPCPGRRSNLAAGSRHTASSSWASYHSNGGF